jgi:hypothetical protein
MKPIPVALLQRLEALPDETCRIILNTNPFGHWEVECSVRFQYDEPHSPADGDGRTWAAGRRLKASKSPY